MHVCIDVKNLALYEGGIAGYARPLIDSWVRARPDVRFTLLGPTLGEPIAPEAQNCEHHVVAWPTVLWRPLRHPVYDNVIFPRAVRTLSPDWLFSFYHDVALPKASQSTRSILMIHDTCLQDLPGVYPARIRGYLLFMLRRNLLRADHILTVSNSSRAAISRCYAIRPERLHVIYNAIERSEISTSERKMLPTNNGKTILYSGGTDARKNLDRMMAAFASLVASGRDIHLCITGSRSAIWEDRLRGVASEVTARVHFLGRLSAEDLQLAYRQADMVLYPTLCEGFGRVCVEAMAVGTVVACSELPVLREIAGDYPVYFNPRDVADIARGIGKALGMERRAAVMDKRFDREAVAESFVDLMNELMVPP